MVKRVKNIDGDMVFKTECKVTHVEDNKLMFECETKHDADNLVIQINEMAGRGVHNWYSTSRYTKQYGHVVDAGSLCMTGSQMRGLLRDKEVI